MLKNDDEIEELNKVTEKIIGAAIEVHQNLGPGLFEHAYETCLCREFAIRAVNFEKQKHLPVYYKGQVVDCSYRVDLLVEGKVIIELKSVSSIQPIHKLREKKKREAETKIIIELNCFTLGHNLDIQEKFISL